MIDGWIVDQVREGVSIYSNHSFPFVFIRIVIQFLLHKIQVNITRVGNRKTKSSLAMMVFVLA